MRKKSYKLLSLLLSIFLFFSFSAFASFADDDAIDTSKKDVSSVTVDQNADTVKGEEGETFNDTSKADFLFDQFNKKTFEADDGIYVSWSGADKPILYKGQKLLIDFYIIDTWDYYNTIPYVALYSVDDDEIVYEWAPAGSYLVVDPDEGYYHFSDYFSVGSKNLTSGDYVIAIAAMPCDEDGWWADDVSSFDIPTEFVNLTVKTLAKPTSVKLKTGTKRVTITFKKSSGAKKYEIYRSTKKSSGYKKIATVTSAKYVDKKAKKGKRYYYKIRAMRGSTTSGKAYSSYTTPKRSGTVK